jgi:hypothetical protein
VKKRDFCDPHHIAQGKAKAGYQADGGQKSRREPTGRTAMTNDFRALARFPAKTVGRVGLGVLAFAAALAVSPAAADPDVALIESLTSHSQHLELMSYAHVGRR